MKRLETGTGFLKGLSLVIGLAASVAIAGPEDITELREINTETVLVDGGAALAAIVYPGPPADGKEEAYWNYADPEGTSEAYAELAGRIASAVESAGGAALPLIRADRYSGEGRERNLIVLGRMNNNSVAYDLYVEQRIAADDWFPGPEGFVVRTVTDPWGKGTNVILLGGSDIAGVRRAVDYFLSLPELGGSFSTLTVPRQWKIDFPGLDEYGEEFAETIAPHYEEEFFSRPFSCGAGGTSGQIWRAAERYFITGLPEYARVFERMMGEVLPPDWSEETTRRLLSDRRGPGGMQRYQAAKIGPLYEAIEDTPHFSDEFRLEMVNWLYKTFWRWCGHADFRDWRNGQIRGLGTWNAARVPVSRGDYFKRYYPHLDFSRYDAALENIKTGLRTLSREHNLFTENGGYTRYGPTIVMDMFRRFDMMEFFESGASERFMEFIIQRTQNGGRRGVYTGLGRPGIQDGWLYPLFYHLKPEYTWTIGQPATSLEPRLEADGPRYRLWTYVPRMETRLPEEMTGILRTGISEVSHERFGTEIPREQMYRILTMRSGYDYDTDQYLLMYGTGRYGLITSGGGSQNEITALQHGRKGSASNARSEVFSIRRDGVDVNLGSFSDLRVVSEQGPAGFVRSVVSGSEVDWSRDIVWGVGDYWLIIDRIALNQAGDYRLALDWNEHGLNIHRAAGETGFSGVFRRGDEYVFANLISGADGYGVRRINDSLYAIDEKGREVLAGSAPLKGSGDGGLELGGGAAVESTFFLLSPEVLAFAGLRRFGGEQPLVEADAAVNLTLDFESGRINIEAAEPARLSFSGIRVSGDTSLELGAGSHELSFEAEPGVTESVARLIGDALELPEAPVAFEPAVIEYPGSLAERWRFETEVTPLVIRTADLNGDGREELLVGLEDGRLIRLSPDGEKQWEFQADGEAPEGHAQAGPLSINDITVADLGEGLRVLATSTDTYVYCLDAATGEVDWKFTGKGLTLSVATGAEESQMEQNSARKPGGPMHGILVADLNGDGEKNVLVGGGALESKSFLCGRLWVLDARGELMWQRFMRWAAAMSQIAVFSSDVDGRRYVAVAGQAGPYSRRIHVFDHEGNTVQFRHPGRYFRVRTAPVGVRGALGDGGTPRLLTLNLLHGPDGPVLQAFSPDPFPEAPGWVYGFPFPIWRFELGRTRPLGFVTADLDGDGIEEIVTGHGGGILYCLKETGQYPSARADVSVQWRLNLREPLAGATNSQMPATPRLAVASLAGGGHRIAVASGQRLFVIDGEGMPLVREEPISEIAVTDWRGNVTRASWSWIGAADLDGGGTESLVAAASLVQRGRAGEQGFVVVYDLAKD